MRKPPPSPILWGLLTPLQKRAPIAASTALPFLGFQDGWVDAFYQKSYLARMSRPTLAQGFESTDTAPCKKRPSLKKKKHWSSLSSLQHPISANSPACFLREQLPEEEEASSSQEQIPDPHPMPTSPLRMREAPEEAAARHPCWLESGVVA